MKKRIQWDERNLEETSAERGTRMKITEPKTPFVKGSQDLNAEEMPDISLDKVSAKLEEYSLDKGHSQSQVHFGDDNYVHDESTEMTDDNEASSGWESSSSQPAEFKKKRTSHYHMGNALKFGKELVEQADEPDQNQRQAKRIQKNLVVSSTTSSAFADDEREKSP